MSIEFMHKMLESYSRVHNKRYWQEIGSVIDNQEFDNARIADLGCGPGLLLADIGTRYQPRELIGIDLSPIMLSRAEEELNKVNKNKNDTNFKISAIQQHLQEDPNLPSELDMIFSSRVLRSFENQAEIMKSIYSSLVKGGFLVLLDWSKSSIQTYEDWFSSVKGEFDDLQPADVINYHRNFSRYDLADWKYILSNFNFDVIHQFQLDAVHSVTIARK